MSACYCTGVCLQSGRCPVAGVVAHPYAGVFPHYIPVPHYPEQIDIETIIRSIVREEVREAMMGKSENKE